MDLLKSSINNGNITTITGNLINGMYYNLSVFNQFPVRDKNKTAVPVNNITVEDHKQAAPYTYGEQYYFYFVRNVFPVKGK